MVATNENLPLKNAKVALLSGRFSHSFEMAYLPDKLEKLETGHAMQASDDIEIAVPDTGVTVRLHVLRLLWPHAFDVVVDEPNEPVGFLGTIGAGTPGGSVIPLLCKTAVGLAL